MHAPPPSDELRSARPVERPLHGPARGAPAAGRGDPAGAGLLAPSAGGLAAGFAALVGLTFCLIVLGALVRANDAGLACPDWPLCFGELIPRFDVKVAFEYTHRFVAGTLGLGFAGLAWATLRRPALRRRCGRAIALASGLLAVQIALGGLTVLKLLAAWTVTSHLLTGNAFAAALLWIALELRDEVRGNPPIVPAPRAARVACSGAAVLLVVQMLLGGLVASRYAGLACTEWPACRDAVWLPSFEGAVGLHLLHRWNAILLVAALALARFAAASAPGLRGIATLALGLALAQVGVGVANVLLALPVEITGLHSALAAGLVLVWTAALRAGGVLGAVR